MHKKEITARIDYACLHVFIIIIFYLINKGTILEKCENYVNKLIKDCARFIVFTFDVLCGLKYTLQTHT